MRFQYFVSMVLFCGSVNAVAADDLLSKGNCQSLDQSIEFASKAVLTCDGIRAVNQLLLVTRPAPEKVIRLGAFPKFDIKLDANYRFAKLCPKDKADADCYYLSAKEITSWAASSLCFAGYVGQVAQGTLTPEQAPQIKHGDISSHLIPLLSNQSAFIAENAELKSQYGNYVERCSMTLEALHQGEKAISVSDGKDGTVQRKLPKKLTEADVFNDCAKLRSEFWASVQKTYENGCQNYLAKKSDAKLIEAVNQLDSLRETGRAPASDESIRSSKQESKKPLTAPASVPATEASDAAKKAQ